LILPSEWLPVIWGGDQPKFETEDEMRTVLGTIMGRYNEMSHYRLCTPDAVQGLGAIDAHVRRRRTSPNRSPSAAAPPTMMATPTKARRLAASVDHAVTPSHIQPRPAVRRGAWLVML
jgi:hypothetical protein